MGVTNLEESTRASCVRRACESPMFRQEDLGASAFSVESRGQQSSKSWSVSNRG